MNIGLGIGIPFTRSSLWSNIFTPTALFMDGSTEGVWYDPSDIKLNWRRNLLTYSEQFDNAAWSQNNITISANAAVSPDGTTTADLIYPTTTGVDRRLLRPTDGALTNGLDYTQSICVKSSGFQWVRLNAVDATSGSDDVWFDVVNGVVGTVGSDAIATQITSAGNGWFRISVTGTAGLNDYFLLALADANNSTSATANGTSGIYIWGAQLELGSTDTEYQRITDGIQDYLTYQPLPVLYQDAAGTTPVTAVEQPVGLMLDKSGRGNHAYQTVSTKRPVLSARVNLLTKTEDFSDAVWSVAGVTRSSDGTITSTVAAGYLYPTVGGLLASASGASYTWIVDVVRGNTSTFKLLVSSATIYQATFDIDAQTVSGVSVNTTASITNLGAGVYRCTLVMSAVANSAYTEFQIGRLASGQTLRLIRSDLRPTNTGVNLPAYQKVNTATDYETQGFPTYLKFDSIDDSMQTNSIDFTATDKMTVFAGVRKLSDGGGAILVELSTNAGTVSGAFYVAAPESTSNYSFKSNGTIGLGPVTANGYAAPVTNVLTGIGDISGDQAILRVNGIQAAISTADQGTGNYGNYPLYIGARAGTSVFFNGLLYQLIIAGGSVINIAEEDLDLVLNEAGDSITAETTVPIGTSTIEACERFVNRKTLAY